MLLTCRTTSRARRKQIIISTQFPHEDSRVKLIFARDIGFLKEKKFVSQAKMSLSRESSCGYCEDTVWILCGYCVLWRVRDFSQRRRPRAFEGFVARSKISACSSTLLLKATTQKKDRQEVVFFFLSFGSVVALTLVMNWAGILGYATGKLG